MAFCNCYCKDNCTAVAIVVALIVGIVAAFAQVMGAIAVSTVFLWAVLGGAAVYLLALVAAAAVGRAAGFNRCCRALAAILVGVLGAIALSAALLLFDIGAGAGFAVLVGIWAFFVALTLTASACYVRCSANCED